MSKEYGVSAFVYRPGTSLIAHWEVENRAATMIPPVSVFALKSDSGTSLNLSYESLAFTESGAWAWGFKDGEFGTFNSLHVYFFPRSTGKPKEVYFVPNVSANKGCIGLTALNDLLVIGMTEAMRVIVLSPGGKVFDGDLPDTGIPLTNGESQVQLRGAYTDPETGKLGVAIGRRLDVEGAEGDGVYSAIAMWLTELQTPGSNWNYLPGAPLLMHNWYEDVSYIAATALGKDRLICTSTQSECAISLPAGRSLSYQYQDTETVIS